MSGAWEHPVAEAVFVHYGSVDDTTAAVRRLDGLCHITVVSNDGTERPSDLAHVNWIVAPRNAGYGGGVNLAVRTSSAEVFVVLNTDIEVSRETFGELVRRMGTTPGAGILAPRLVFPGGQPQSGAGHLTSRLKLPRMDVSELDCRTRADWVTGAVMVVDGDFLRQNPFQEGYFLGCEDVELCLRAADAGLAVLCEGDLVAEHDRSRVIGGMWYYYGPRNEVWFVRQRFGAGRGALVWLYYLLRGLVVVAGDCAKRRGLTNSRRHFAALRDALRPVPVAPLVGEPIPLRKNG